MKNCIFYDLFHNYKDTHHGEDFTTGLGKCQEFRKYGTLGYGFPAVSDRNEKNVLELWKKFSAAVY